MNISYKVMGFSVMDDLLSERSTVFPLKSGFLRLALTITNTIIVTLVRAPP